MTMDYNNNKTHKFKVGIDKGYGFKYIYGTTKDYLNISNYSLSPQNIFTGIYYVGQYGDNNISHSNDILFENYNLISVGFHNNTAGVGYIDLDIDKGKHTATYITEGVLYH